MKPRYFFTSLTRISDLPETLFSAEPLPRREWETGDYVVGKVISPPSRLSGIELSSGRMVEVTEGDLVVGAFGVRYATLEAVGGWQNIGAERQMEALTGAGLFGKATSRSAMLPSLIALSYNGHVVVNGGKATMRDFVIPTLQRGFDLPVVLLVGTSMSAGKTTSAKVIIRLLRQEGLAVVGAKLTGAGRYRDILSMQDAGAEHIFDFVDAGLPSTVVSAREYKKSLRNLLARMASVGGDVVVAEVGASPPGALQRRDGYRGDRRERAMHRALRLRPLRRDRRDVGLPEPSGPRDRARHEHGRGDRAYREALRHSGPERTRPRLPAEAKECLEDFSGTLTTSSLAARACTVRSP